MNSVREWSILAPNFSCSYCKLRLLKDLLNKNTTFTINPSRHPYDKFTFRCIFKAVNRWSTACLFACRLMQLIPRLYRHRMKPGLRFSACLYASTASSLRPPFASVAPSLFQSSASFGTAWSAAWKQSTALSYSPDRLNRTPRPTWGGRGEGANSEQAL